MQAKLPRKITDQELCDLKATTRQCVDLARPTKLAMITRVDAAALSKYGAVSEPGFMPIDVVIDLCRDIDSPALVEEMARLLGYRLVPIDGGERDSEISADDLADIAKETGDVVVALASALPGGVDRHERRGLRPEIQQAITSLRRLERKVGAA